MGAVIPRSRSVKRVRSRKDSFSLFKISKTATRVWSCVSSSRKDLFSFSRARRVEKKPLSKTVSPAEAPVAHMYAAPARAQTRAPPPGRGGGAKKAKKKKK